MIKISAYGSLQDETVFCLLLLQVDRFCAGDCSSFAKKESSSESISYVIAVQSLARGVLHDLGSVGSDGFQKGDAVQDQPGLGTTTGNHSHVHRVVLCNVYDVCCAKNLSKLSGHDGNSGGEIPHKKRYRSTRIPSGIPTVGCDTVVLCAIYQCLYILQRKLGPSVDSVHRQQPGVEQRILLRSVGLRVDGFCLYVCHVYRLGPFHHRVYSLHLQGT